MTGKTKLMTPGGGGVILQPASSVASDVTVNVPSVNATLLTDSTGVLNIGSGQIYKDASGNLGIGTSSPSGKVDVASTSTTQSVFRALNNGSNWSQILCGYNGTSANYYDADTQIFRNGATQTERMRIDSSGNLLVGTTTDLGDGISLRVRPGGSATSMIYFNRANTTTSATALAFANNGVNSGSITYTNTATAYNTSSDYRLKENIQPMQGALDVVAQLNPVTYTWKADGSDGQGFIAHELQAVVPDCVTGEKDAVDEEGKPVYQGIDTSFLVATLTKAIQELSAQTTALKAELDATKAEVATLKGASV